MKGTPDTTTPAKRGGALQTDYADIESNVRLTKQNTSGGSCVPPEACQSRNCPQEGVSFTKVSRGDWIRTSDLLNPIQTR
jgi:hypothetical protein